ncbi:MAG: DUF883 family protein [Burkholderiaceae bacterium]|jgi:ElaB/YqjD/DUF883 family membrane-anchored ribosome-binding protein|nr:DUF883 family protein [Burkholderiaceae bacterium]
MSTTDQLAGAAAESKEQLVANLRRVIVDAEELLAATASENGGKLADLRERIKDNLRVARDKLADAESLVRERARRAAEITDDYVHDNPWPSIGAAGALGLVVGMLIGSRR